MTEPIRVDEAVDSLIDLKLIEHLDFEPRCERLLIHAVPENGRVVHIEDEQTERCVAEASWIFHCTACHGTCFLCDEHRTSMATAEKIACGRCLQVLPPDRFIFKRLSGA